MHVTELGLRTLCCALSGKFTGGTYNVGTRSALLCRIVTDDGLEGLVCVGNEETYSDFLIGLIRGFFRSALLGEDPLLIDKHWHTMLRAGRGYVDISDVMQAIAVVDTALWDLKGKITGQPVWKLIGGAREKVPIIGIGGYYETAADEAGIREEIAFMKRMGLGGIKFKVGAAGVDIDAQRVRTAREIAGGDFILVVDSNRSWEPREAAAFAKRIASTNPEWLEEPIRRQDVATGLRDFRLKCGIRTAAGQSELSVFECHEMIARGSVDVMNMTYNRGGGVTAWVKLASAAALRGVEMAQVAEPHIGMHLIAGVSNTTFVECYPSQSRDPIWHGLYANRPEPNGGFITLPDAPGFGLTLKRDFIECHAKEGWD